ncbi:hypothetical protein M1P97_00690 [Parabacteroides sp. GYB001]|uniref:hypothetical protein n=1 Tax=Parabacteroides leei TaxID=2939491 RepID=UPI0020170D2F|nr:hypothetical protein [Parabacteroides leei]MCL3849808.1 hypothetical protein [Parabacteroides leei]
MSAYDCEEAEVLNEASLRGGLKNRLDILADCIAFYIDRSGNYRDRVSGYVRGNLLRLFRKN